MSKSENCLGAQAQDFGFVRKSIKYGIQRSLSGNRIVDQPPLYDRGRGRRVNHIDIDNALQLFGKSVAEIEIFR